MADVIGTVSGVVGITLAALHAIRILINDIENIKDAPETIGNVKRELESVEGVLNTLEKTLRDENILSKDFEELVGGANVESAMKNCEGACKRFQSTLKKWWKHSTDTDIHWWDRAKVGFFGEKRVAAFTTELNSCKATVSMALNSANLSVCPEFGEN
jgi:hypothetical protein